MPIPFFDLKRQYPTIQAEVEQATKEVLAGTHYILGKTVAALEKKIAAYCGTKYAIGVASGTDALHLGLRACGIKAGDEVITTPFTFVAIIEAILYIGAKPVFVDIDEKTFNLDPKKIAAKITPKTKAILPVHLYGLAAEMGPIMELAKKHNLKIIEDCAQALGAKYDGKIVGGIGDVGCFSFFPTKNLGGAGDGGMITTNDAKIDEEIRTLRDHGSRQKYVYDELGFNSRLDELQAAILVVKLNQLESWTKARQRNASLYNELLKGLPLTTPQVNAKSYHVYNQYTIRTDKREALQKHLKSKGIGTNIYYPLSLHQQKAYQSLGSKQGDFPVSEKVQEKVLSLPIFPELTPDEVKMVAQEIKEFFKK